MAVDEAGRLARFDHQFEFVELVNRRNVRRANAAPPQKCADPELLAVLRRRNALRGVDQFLLAPTQDRHFADDLERSAQWRLKREQIETFSRAMLQFATDNFPAARQPGRAVVGCEDSVRMPLRRRDRSRAALRFSNPKRERGRAYYSVADSRCCGAFALAHASGYLAFGYIDARRLPTAHLI